MKRPKRLLSASVGIICPTYSKKLFFDRFIPSIKHIKEISYLSTFLLNFNGPDWGDSRADMDAAIFGIESLGFRTESIYTGTWDKPVKVLKMREQCAGLYPNADLYLYVDDDFRFVGGTKKYPFSSGRRYLHSIDYMRRFERCGVVNTKSFLGGSIQKLKIVPIKGGDLVATGQGLFLKNMKEHGYILYPKETHDLAGGLEETLAAMVRVEQGYFIAKQMNNPTVHITGKLSDYDHDNNDFHNIGVINSNIGDYLRDKYNDWDWLFEERKYPKRLWEMYDANGGLEIGDNLVINYADYEPHWDETSIGKKS